MLFADLCRACINPLSAICIRMHACKRRHCESGALWMQMPAVLPNGLAASWPVRRTILQLLIRSSTVSGQAPFQQPQHCFSMLKGIWKGCCDSKVASQSLSSGIMEKKLSRTQHESHLLEAEQIITPTHLATTKLAALARKGRSSCCPSHPVVAFVYQHHFVPFR